MAQMAPALAEAAASPSSNGNISSSNAQNPLRESYIEEEDAIDSSKLQKSSTKSHHNGFCRSMANSNIKTSGKRAFDEFHKSNKLTHSFHNPPESIKLSKHDIHSVPLATCGENTVSSQEIGPIFDQNETLNSTPTRIPITTTRTCGSNSLENRSSCQASDNKTNDESQQRHSFPCPEPSPRVLLQKKVKNVGFSQARISARAQKLERRLRTLQSRQLESHATDQLQKFALSRRKSQHVASQQKHEQTKQELALRQPSQSSSDDTQVKSVVRVGDEVPANAPSGQKNEHKHIPLGGNNVKTVSGCVLNSANEKEAEGNAARTLVSQLELAEHVGDSDATECSSGAESCDEMDYTANAESKGKG